MKRRTTRKHGILKWMVSCCVCPSLLLLLLLNVADALSFLPYQSRHEVSSTLFSTPAPRQPRRMLKKRRRNPANRKNGNVTPAQEFPWDSTESRPLVKAKRQEAGEDYWMDEKEYQAFESKQQAIKNRKALEGEVPKEKLWSEVKAPYKQNWIGYFSVFIAILSAIIIKFPELLDQPTIPIPDL